MSQLNHDNVVKLRGYFTRPSFGMVLELMHGGDLYHYLNDPLCISRNLLEIEEAVGESIRYKNVRGLYISEPILVQLSHCLVC